MNSFWEAESMLRYDAIVVGGGIIGLSTAIELAERNPTMTIAVLERGILPSGASTRNAGFACFGSLTEILADVASVGAEDALRTIERRYRGLGLLRRRLGDEGIGFEGHGGYELLLENHAGAIDRIDEANALLGDLFAEPVFRNRYDLIDRFGFDRERVRGLVFNPYEGQIDTGRMMRSLARLASDRGVTILTGCEVSSIEGSATGVSIRVRDGRTEETEFHADMAAVCTNALIPDLAPELPIRPGRGQVLITSAIDGLPWQGTFHIDEGFYYFRNVGNRVLLGGGRNLDFEHETTSEFGPNEMILERLRELLSEVIVPGREFTVERQWSGIMGFTPDKLPIVREIGNNIAVGFGCNGMGIALASTIAEEVATLMTP